MSIVYRPTIQFTRDECLLFSAVWEHGCRGAEARGHDPELDDIPGFIERALNDWPFFRAPAAKSTGRDRRGTCGAQDR